MPGRSGSHGGLGHFDHVVDFQRFNAGGIENLGGVCQPYGQGAFAQGVDFFHAFIHERLRAENARVRLHGAADFVGHILRVLAIGVVLDTVEALQREISSISWQRLVRALFVMLDDVIASCLAENQQVKQGIRSQPVGAVHADA